MAFTTVFAGFALTTHILPKISLLPAFVAGLTRVLTMATPGMVNFPVFFTSLAAKEVKKTGKFTIPGVAMVKTRVKPATKAGKREIFGKMCVVKAKPAKTVVKAYAVAAIKKAV